MQDGPLNAFISAFNIAKHGKIIYREPSLFNQPRILGWQQQNTNRIWGSPKNPETDLRAQFADANQGDLRRCMRFDSANNPITLTTQTASVSAQSSTLLQNYNKLLNQALMPIAVNHFSDDANLNLNTLALRYGWMAFLSIFGEVQNFGFFHDITQESLQYRIIIDENNTVRVQASLIRPYVIDQENLVNFDTSIIQTASSSSRSQHIESNRSLVSCEVFHLVCRCVPSLIQPDRDDYPDIYLELLEGFPAFFESAAAAFRYLKQNERNLNPWPIPQSFGISNLYYKYKELSAKVHDNKKDNFDDAASILFKLAMQLNRQSFQKCYRILHAQTPIKPGQHPQPYDQHVPVTFLENTANAVPASKNLEDEIEFSGLVRALSTNTGHGWFIGAPVQIKTNSQKLLEQWAATLRSWIYQSREQENARRRDFTGPWTQW